VALARTTQLRPHQPGQLVEEFVGGGIVLNGELLEGATGNAGHVGHIIVEPNGRRCACGGRGCLEAEASGPAIEAITGRPPTEPTYETMQRAGRLVGRGIASVCNRARSTNCAASSLRRAHGSCPHVSPTRDRSSVPPLSGGAVSTAARVDQRIHWSRSTCTRVSGCCTSIHSPTGGIGLPRARSSMDTCMCGGSSTFRRCRW
ncbi:MAG: hypothetical protein RLZZ93_1544, partial [Actinomycetota bacterium]